jgi:hypothetical protein
MIAALIITAEKTRVPTLQQQHHRYQQQYCWRIYEKVWQKTEAQFS